MVGEMVGDYVEAAIVDWDHKDRPDFNEISEASQSVVPHGQRAYQAEVRDTGCDSNGLVISGRQLTDDQVQKAWAMYVARGWNNPAYVRC